LIEKPKRNKSGFGDQKLNYFYNGYRKELLADNRDRMSFTSGDPDKVIFCSF